MNVELDPKVDVFRMAVWFDDDHLELKKNDFRNENKVLNRLSAECPITKWYFRNIAAASRALEIVIKEVECGKTTVHLDQLVAFKLRLAALDEHAEFQGMRFDGNFKTSAELLEPQLRKMYWLITKHLHKVFMMKVIELKRKEVISISTSMRYVHA